MNTEQRAEWVKRMAVESGLVKNSEAEFFTLVCDRCGASVSKPTALELAAATTGWFVGCYPGTKDFCPDCLTGLWGVTDEA